CRPHPNDKRICKRSLIRFNHEDHRDHEELFQFSFVIFVAFVVIQGNFEGYDFRDGFCCTNLVAMRRFSSMTRFELRHEDCIGGMSRLGDESVDVVVTSPPYNLGIDYGKYSDRQDRQSYLRWCHGWAEQVRRILKPTGSFFLNIGAAPSNPMLPHEMVIELRDLFVLQNTIHWIKSIAIEDRCSRRPVGDVTRATQTRGSSASHTEAATA